MQNIRFLLPTLLCFILFGSISAQNIPRANFSGPMDAEVNTYNGNLYLERTDVSLPNQDLPLAISFSFNSFQDSTDLGYGYGWSHNYGLRFEELTDAVVIQRAHGRRDTFPIGNEQYQAPPGIFDVLASPAAGQYTLTTKDGMVYAFEESAHRYLTRLTNTNGRSLNLFYTDTLLTSVSDASGRLLVLAYQGGRLNELIDNNYPGGRKWQYTFASGGQLAAVTDPLSNTVNYGYDAAGRLTSYVDERGSGLDIAYGPTGRVATLRTCITQVDFAFNEAQGRTIISEQNEGTDQLTTHVYDREGRLVRKTGNCCGYDMAFNYDGNNNLADMRDANGNTIVGLYDDFGNTVATRDAMSERQAFTFGDLNRMTSFTDKRGNTTNMSYDGQGNLIRVNQPENTTIDMQYDGRGNLTQLANGRRKVTRMRYNGNNDLTEVTYPIGQETYGYDGVGNMTITTDPNGNPTYFTYDALNRLISIKDAEGDSIRYGYDGASNLELEIDGNGNEKRYAYDAHNRLISVITEIGTTRYGYDKLDNLTSITNAEGHTSHFAYDTRSRLTMESDAMGFSTFYEYDANGNVISRIDGNLQVTSYTYDAQDRLLSKTYAGNTDNYAYDAGGNLLRASNNDITYEFSYDALNRMTRKYVVEWDMAIEYQYDANGNRTQMTDPDGGNTRYIYDNNDRLILLINPFGETFRFAYDNGGRLLRQDNFNRTYATYEYDQANRLTLLRNLKSDGTVISSYAYDYDANGLRTSMTDEEGQHNYVYDEENRLAGVTYANGTEEVYEFDDAGNRIKLMRDGVETLYTYDAADRIINAGNIRFEFDGNGNMVRKIDGEEETTYRWDGENRLVGVDDDISFVTDPFDHRISEITSSDESHLFWDEDNLLIRFSSSSATRYIMGLGIDEFLSYRNNDGAFSLHSDGLSTIKNVTTRSGDIIGSYKFDVYGNFQSQGSLPSDFRAVFSGREYTPVTELYYFRSRSYDPAQGRFILSDSYPGIDDRPLSQNRFSFLEQNPVNYRDPYGTFIPQLIGIIAGAGFETFNQYRKHGTNFKCYDLFDIAVSGAFGVLGVGTLGVGKTVAAAYVKPLRGFVAKKLPPKSGWIKSKVHGFFSSPFKDIKSLGFWKHRDIKSTANKAIKKKIVADEAKKRIKEQGNVQVGDECDESPGNQEPEDPTPPPTTDPPTTPTPPGSDGKPKAEICIPIIQPIDPNEIIGPEGIGAEKWVKGDATLPYTVLYENDPEFATAAAQRVFLTHPFDDSVNPYSFRIGSFGFGSFFFEVPEGLSYYNTQLDLRDSLGVYLNVVAGIDVELNQAFWIFESVDPETGFTETLPAEVGYLPVNDTITRKGEGFVNFTIRPSASAELGDRIEAKASIIFDDNDAIETNVEINTIDPEIPTSQVNSIDTLGGGGYRLIWSGTEMGSGMANVTLFVATDEGAFLPTNTLNGTSGSYDFDGTAASTYQFFTIARDSVGNVERMKAVGEPACMAISVVSQADASGGNSNGSVEIIVSGGSGDLMYAWEHAPGLRGPSAANLAPGLYRVVVTDARGCIVEAVINIALLNSTIAPAAAPQIVKLYPVPSHESITMDFYAPDNVLSAVIYDAIGRATMRQTVTARRLEMNSQSFDISNLPAGTYFLRLESRKGTYSVGTFFKQ